jgi:DNA polymerase (family 10)
MTPLDASEVAKLLAEYGRRAALAGGNPYRSKAYLRAAEACWRSLSRSTA